MLPAKVGSIWPSSFRGEDVLTLANQKQDLNKYGCEEQFLFLIG
jgi:hypothetical protein